MLTAYDTWRLAAPEDDLIGTQIGEECRRYPEPDEDAPRGWRPRRCTGVMFDDDGIIVCDTCGELA